VTLAENAHLAAAPVSPASASRSIRTTSSSATPRAPSRSRASSSTKSPQSAGVADYEAFVALHIRRRRSIFGLFSATPASQAEYAQWVADGRPPME
jgi:hypothetical protein